MRTIILNARELARFLLSGVAATAGNVATFWATRAFVSFEFALLAGILAGVVLSFTLSKLFAFRSRSWSRAGGEAARFLIVYAISLALYWAVAVTCAHTAFILGVATEATEIGGVLIGAATMTVTSYLGHRFFTYRTHQRADQRLGGVL